MAKLDYTGLERYMQDLEKIATQGEILKIEKKAVYKGVEVVADGIRASISAHPVHIKAAHGMTAIEKKGLLQGLGTSRINSNSGDLSGKIGFAGYNSVSRSKKWPNGVPIPLTARSLLKGTSWRVKDDFMGPAVRKYKDKAISAMDDEIQKSFEEKLKG